MSFAEIDFVESKSESKIRVFRHPVQLDLFKTDAECEIEALAKICEEVKLSSNKVRKKLFAENGELRKRIMDLEERLAILERNICRGN